jgi:hypothetical protein
VQTFAQGGKRRFDQIQARVVAEREQAFNVRLWYSNTAGKLRFLQT